MDRILKLKKITDKYPLYSRLLAQAVEKAMSSLPDFSKENNVFIFSDYGGEHKTADFFTYSFLITSPARLSEFKNSSSEIRSKFNLNQSFKEFAYKDLNNSRIKNALGSYLDAANLIFGVLVTIAIEKSILSVFEKERKTAEHQIQKILRENNLGDWNKAAIAEKLLRIGHPIALYLALLQEPSQKILWLSDNDAINADGKSHSFIHTQQIFFKLLQMYTDKPYEIYGFAKPFEEKGTYFDDLLSLTDLSAGVMQELMQSQITLKENMLTEEKQKVVAWFANSNSILTKHNFVYTKTKDSIEISNVFF